MAENLIPEKYNKAIVTLLLVVVGVLTMMVEGKWFGADTLVWLDRTIKVIAVLSTVFGWGIVARPGAK